MSLLSIYSGSACAWIISEINRDTMGELQVVIPKAAKYFVISNGSSLNRQIRQLAPANIFGILIRAFFCAILPENSKYSGTKCITVCRVWENSFAGSFSVDEDGIFHSDLYDELRDTEIQITFTVDVVNATTDKGEITFTITDTNLDKYKSLVDKPITFVLDSTPNY